MNFFCLLVAFVQSSESPETPQRNGMPAISLTSSAICHKNISIEEGRNRTDKDCKANIEQSTQRSTSQKQDVWLILRSGPWMYPIPRRQSVFATTPSISASVPLPRYISPPLHNGRGEWWPRRRCKSGTDSLLSRRMQPRLCPQAWWPVMALALSNDWSTLIASQQVNISRYFPRSGNKNDAWQHHLSFKELFSCFMRLTEILFSSLKLFLCSKQIVVA